MLIWTDEVDLKNLYFVTSDLKDLERPSELVVLLHFGEHGYFTVQSLAPAACTAAQSNSDQQKTIATFCAQATPIDFTSLQEKYLRLLSARMTLFEIHYQVAAYKDKIAQIVLSLNQLHSGLHTQALPEPLLRYRESLTLQADFSKALLLESSGQQEIAENFLRAHVKKHSERLNQLQAQRQRLENWQKLLLLRKIKMLCEVNSIFVTESVLEGFKLIGTNWVSEKEAEITTALGYCCLILRGLEGYLGLKLQYQVRFQGSRSCLIVGDREFQLYATGKNTDRVRMGLAVQYLVQNLRFALKSLGHSADIESSMLLSTLIEYLPRYRG